KMPIVAGCLAAYGSDSESENESAQYKSRESRPRRSLTSSTVNLLCVRVAVLQEDVETGTHIDPSLKELLYNPTYETMFAPEFGAVNPFKTQQMAAPRNMLSGYAEPAHVNDFMFEQQRRTVCVRPSVDSSQVSSSSYIGAVEEAEKKKGMTVFESGLKKEKRKRVKGGDASEIDSFLGPWAKYQDEKDVAKPSEEEQKELDEITAKRQKRGKNEEEAFAEEKTILHVKDAYDYPGRSYLHVPQDVGINLRLAEIPDKCYLPKKQLHVWTGHTKGVSAIQLFPGSGHLLLSCSMDCKIKVVLYIAHLPPYSLNIAISH
uniref:Uncharacterized protein n=1 Tax=Electrophorus electricus TaxID=8005 RepID=A0AAY5EUN7_ELEEL